MLPEMPSLAKKSHWISVSNNQVYNKPAQHSVLRNWIVSQIPERILAKRDKTCFEVGVVPGRYLSVFGDLGFEVNGIDYVDNYSAGLRKWLEDNHYKVGELYEGDFFKFSTEKKFDVVYSLGFIEHFEDFQEVIRLQCRLVKPGGLLVLEVPNLRGLFNRMYYYLFDYESLRIHNLKAMQFNEWIRVLSQMNFKVTKYDYLGGLRVLVYHDSKYWLQKVLLKLLLFIEPYLRRVFKGPSSYYSHVMVMAAVNIESTTTEPD